MSSSISETDIRSIFDSLPGIYLILKPDFTMVAANDARLKATMTTREDTLGRNLFDLFPDNPDDPAATGVANLRASLQRVLATKQSDTLAVQKYDIRRPDSEGGGFEERYWSPMNSPVLNEKGEVTYIIHRVEDVTEFVRLKQKGAEQSKLTEELKAQVQKTEMEVYLRAQEVQEANQKLRELDRLKTEFFANVSHELRTPLTLILAPIEALLSRSEAGTAVAPRDILKIVHNNATRLLQMVNGLLDFEKLSANKTEVKREPVNILDLTRSIFWDFRGVMGQKGIQEELSADAPHPIVEMDRYLYERVLFNLISNAVKFTPRGGKISVALESEDGQLTLSVTDTGIGISEWDQKKLFEKFHQVEASSTRRFEGTGLGLALARECAQLLGGTVTVQSQVGKGSTFTLTCQAPLSQAETVSIASPDRVALVVSHLETHGDGKKELSSLDRGSLGDQEDMPKVLIAEDNPELAAFVTSLLSPFCRVQVAVDGAEALDWVRRWRPDLVLSDVMMPKVDGIRLTREIKADKETSSIPVVLLTAMTNRESLLKGWEAGADDYLFKPFHPKELEARVKSLLATLEWRRKGEAYRRQRDALEHFTHIASHDLREPLRKIVNFVQLFQSHQKNLDKESEGYLQSVSKGAARMYRLLDVLMDYSRLDRDTSNFEAEDLKKIVEDVREDLSEEIEKAGASVIVDSLPELPVLGGPISLVFQNLIGNSLKYRKDGLVPQIRIGADRKDLEWVFSVADNGIGFDPTQSEKIFIMFERLHGTEKYSGDGMGLAICRKIIEKHGGRIWADSKPGEGSTFYFTLPVEWKKTDLSAVQSAP